MYFFKDCEGVLNDQLQTYFDTILSILLATFCKMYSCQSVHLKMVEDWKKALDTGIIVINLSKAFDSILHSYLITKLESYRLSESDVKLLSSYSKTRCNEKTLVIDIIPGNI